MIEKAYAKVNLFLNVVTKREDGYHELNMITHPIELHDTLIFEESDQIELVGSQFKDDIILKTVKMFFEEAKIEKGIKITLIKKIPIGAGLGGGSADAAATLRGLNRFFDKGYSTEELANIGIQLGADVPICIFNRAATVKGIGEKIEFLPPVNGEVLLVIPNEQISTAKVFKSIDPLTFKDVSEIPVKDALKENNITKYNKIKLNDLEKATVLLSKECNKVYKLIKEINPDFMMTGSGAVFFNIYDCENTLIQNAKELDRYAINWQRTQLLTNL